MSGKNIHLIRSSQVKPFVETASRLGAPVRDLATQSGLDLQSVLAGEGVIGEHSAWDFIALASREISCEHFGYQVALDHPVNHSGQLGGMSIQRAADLNGILHWFTSAVSKESDNADYRLLSGHDGIWFCRTVPWHHEAGWIIEKYVLSFIIQIVRLCAPGDWLPLRIKIATRKQPVPLPPEWSFIKAEWGCRNTELLIERDLLTTPPRYPGGIGLSNTPGDRKNALLIQDLVDRQIWNGQIGMRYAARELGMSTATLKRRLGSMQTSYSAILSERRQYHACRLLEESDLAIAHISRTLGYAAVANFSRAFKRTAGLSPAAYRSSRADASARTG